MAFVPSYGYARAVTRGTRNSARAYQEKMVGTAKYKTNPKRHKEAYEISRRGSN